MKENWVLRKRPYKGILSRLPVSPVLARVISNRIPEEEAEEYYEPGGPLNDPFLMRDMEKAVSRLLYHIEQNHNILILGDYDVDGVTSSTILYLALSALGARVSVRIPERMKDGYGIREYMVEEARASGVRLIVTCDNGIREFPSMERAEELGIEVIITDHHEITKDADGKDVLPRASCILNPARQDCGYPFKGLCGAGVAYKLAQAVCQRAECPLDPSLIGYAALGTVCDVMKLTGENRRIVYQGLREWNERPPVGIKALMDEGGIDSLDVYQFGFVIGPMLNSGGRLETQEKYSGILRTQDPEEAAELARALKQLNAERQKLTADGVAAAGEIVESQQDQDMIKVIYLPDVHESVAGQIAGKIREKYHRPVFVLTGSAGEVKGSGRSVPGYDMFAEMQKQDGLFLRYGGHPMAAGLSMKEENIGRLREQLNAACRLTAEDCVPEVVIDAALPLPRADLALAQELTKLEPYGNGNERPLFAEKGLELRRVRLMGKNRSAARLTFLDQNEICEAVTFRVETLEEVVTERYGAGIWQRLAAGEEFHESLYLDVCYNLNVNEFRGVRSAQRTICNFR